MSKYGYAALLATKLFRDGQAPSPNAAWDMAVLKVFPSSISAQKKGCPRGAYLGLCESGVIAGIPQGSYCRAEKNKGYALKAVSFLVRTPDVLPDEDVLWRQVMQGEEKVPNHQMDVVLTLWREGYIHA